MIWCLLVFQHSSPTQNPTQPSQLISIPIFHLTILKLILFLGSLVTVRSCCWIRFCMVGHTKFVSFNSILVAIVVELHLLCKDHFSKWCHGHTLFNNVLRFEICRTGLLTPRLYHILHSFCIPSINN
jgi:hypothetical protein